VTQRPRTTFKELCKLCEILAQTPSRNMKIKLTADFLAKLESGREVSDAVGLMLGKPLRDLQLNVGYNHLMKVLMEIVGVGEKGFLAEFNRTLAKPLEDCWRKAE